MSMTVAEVKNVYTSSSKSEKSGRTDTAYSAGSKPQGTGDSVDIKQTAPIIQTFPEKTYTIKDGDALQKIASEHNLNLQDLIDQLKDQGKLPKDYDPHVRHAHDISWMKAGNKITFRYPKTEQQLEKYDDFTTQRTRDYYNRKAAAEREAKLKEASKPQAPEQSFMDKILDFIGF